MTETHIDADLDLIDLLIATGEIGERPTAYSGARPYGTTLRARRALRRLADMPGQNIFNMGGRRWVKN